MKPIELTKNTIQKDLKWAAGYYIKDRERLTEFLKLIDEIRTDGSLIYRIDEINTDGSLIYYIKEFRKLPEVDLKKRASCSSDALSEQALSYFVNFEQLSQTNPVLALKLVLALPCHEEIYPRNEPFTERLKLAVRHCFFLDSIPLETRLELCIKCVKQWPIRYQKKYDGKGFFSEILPQLFIQFDKNDPQKAWALFESNFPENDTYFFSPFEERSHFLPFISNHIEDYPQKYIETLCDYLSHVERNEHPNENVINVGKKLYEVVSDPKFANTLSAENNKLLKYAYSTLLKKSDPLAPGYPELAYRLWEIEAIDTHIDEYALSRYCTIVINAPDAFTYIDDVCQKYREWAILYEKIPHHETDQFEKHAKIIIGMLNYSLFEFPFYRNCYIPLADIAKVCGQFMGTIVQTYWEMAESLLKNNLVAYFYTLEVAIRKDHFTCEETDKVAARAETQFFEHLEALIGRYPQESIHFIGKTIGDTIYSNYKNLYPFLDRLIPAVIQLNPKVAKASVQIGLNYQRNDRQPSVWAPRDLGKNPVFQGVTRPEISYL